MFYSAGIREPPLCLNLFHLMFVIGTQKQSDTVPVVTYYHQFTWKILQNTFTTRHVLSAYHVATAAILDSKMTADTVVEYSDFDFIHVVSFFKPFFVSRICWYSFSKLLIYRSKFLLTYWEHF